MQQSLTASWQTDRFPCLWIPEDRFWPCLEPREAVCCQSICGRGKGGSPQARGTSLCQRLMSPQQGLWPKSGSSALKIWWEMRSRVCAWVAEERSWVFLGQFWSGKKHHEGGTVTSLNSRAVEGGEGDSENLLMVCPISIRRVKIGNSKGKSIWPKPFVANYDKYKCWKIMFWKKTQCFWNFWESFLNTLLMFKLFSILGLPGY